MPPSSPAPINLNAYPNPSLPHRPQNQPASQLLRPHHHILLHGELRSRRWPRELSRLVVLQSGADRAGKLLGLPYGSYARYILLFLQSQAVKTGTREIELGRSVRVWLGSMGLSIGGTTYRLANEQARRISGCTLTFFADRGSVELMRRGGFVDGAITMTDVLGDQPGLWQERVLLNEEFLPCAARASCPTRRECSACDWPPVDGYRYLHLALLSATCPPSPG